MCILGFETPEKPNNSITCLTKRLPMLLGLGWVLNLFKTDFLQVIRFGMNWKFAET